MKRLEALRLQEELMEMRRMEEQVRCQAEVQDKGKEIKGDDGWFYLQNVLVSEKKWLIYMAR